MIFKNLIIVFILIFWQSNVWSQKMTIVDGQMVEYKEPVDTTSYFKTIFLNISFEKAIEKAANENKNVLLYFTARGCGYCHLMEHTILSDSITKKINTEFISVRNLSDSCGYFLEDKYKVRAFPTFLILDNKEAVIKKHIGYMTLPELDLFLDLKTI